MDGLGAVAKIHRARPDQTILMLTRHARPGVLHEALKLGVQGFVSKSPVQIQARQAESRAARLTKQTSRRASPDSHMPKCFAKCANRSTGRERGAFSQAPAA
ncbi:hypothetical protein GCM10009733_059370 [Nonomuraea maheshkhaliensis]|uniref:Response regulatory domain-containing protein n=1 Tax=Nonomuraea maheshkhaliensis TaxID=419590 RepID=A0ABP4RLL8_9ACTN